MEQLSSFAENFKKTEAMGYIKSMTTKVKQMALNLTDLEVKVEEATNNEPWGPHGSAMAEISEAAFDGEGYRQIMGVIARRLQDTGELWRHVYKSLLLLEYMLKHGPQKVVQELSSNIIIIEKLQNFQYKDKNLRDHGENVRHRAKQLADLVLDPNRVREERKKAKELKSKYTGVSSDAMRMRRTGGGGGGSGGGLGGGNSYGGSSRYDDSDEDDVFASRSSRTSASGDRGAVGQSSRNGSDSVEATRARIEALREREASEKDAEGEGTAARQGRKLSNMRVDPKVSASLGLKVPPAPALKPKSAAAAAKPAAGQEVDLMGGLAEEPAAAAAGGVRSSTDWDAFAGADSPAAPAAAAADANGTSWANFEAAPSKPKAAADPVADLFALDSAPAAAAPAKPAAAAAPADPFGDFGSASPAATASPAAATPPGSKPSTGSSKAALPEDIFSELPKAAPVAATQPQPGFVGGAPYGAAPPQGGLYQQQQPGTGFPAQPAGAQFGQAPAAAAPHGQQPAPAFAAFATTPPAQQQGLPGMQSTGSTSRGPTGSGEGGSSGPTLGGKPQRPGVDPDPFAGLGW